VCFSELTRGKLVRTALRRIARFCSKNFADRRSDREKSSANPSRAFPTLIPSTSCQWLRSLSRARVEWSDAGFMIFSWPAIIAAGKNLVADATIHKEIAKATESIEKDLMRAHQEFGGWESEHRILNFC